MMMTPGKANSLNSFPPEAYSHNPSGTTQSQVNQASMNIYKNLTCQCSGLGQKEGSPEMYTYDSADSNRLQSHVLGWTSSSLMALWH